MIKKLKKIWNKLLTWTIYMIIMSVTCQDIKGDCKCDFSTLIVSKPSAGRVYGGEDAQFNEFPWQTAMILPTSDNYYIGQGSVVSNLIVLTCAHMFYDLDPLTHKVAHDYLNTPISAVIGSRFIIKNESVMTPEEINAYQIRPIKFVTLHPQYVPLVYNNDIAVVQFVEAIPGWYVGLYPVCLAWDFSITYEKEWASFSGYGALSGDSGTSNILQKASLGVQENSICTRQGPGFYDDTKMMCAYNPTQSPCRWDSGGPLVYYNDTDKHYYQIGIYTLGYPCTADNVARYVQYYTKVTAFYVWIVGEINDTLNCS